VKLSDFGIAKAVTYSSVFYRVRGKVGYMSPEQARNLPIDARSDLFSLGVCIFETLLGERLYTGDLQTPADVIYAQPIPQLRERCPQLPAELENVLRHALAQDPDQRFADAAEFGQALRHVARRHGLLYSGPELSNELGSLLGDDADRWLNDDSTVSMVTQGMPEPRQLEGKEAASIGIGDSGASPGPRNESPTVPVLSNRHPVDGEASRATGLVTPPPPPRRMPRRLVWAAAVLAVLMAVGVLGGTGGDNNPLSSAMKTLRHKLASWGE
jgi:serine/threonine protein kinase